MCCNIGRCLTGTSSTLFSVVTKIAVPLVGVAVAVDSAVHLLGKEMLFSNPCGSKMPAAFSLYTSARSYLKFDDNHCGFFSSMPTDQMFRSQAILAPVVIVGSLVAYCVFGRATTNVPGKTLEQHSLQRELDTLKTINFKQEGMLVQNSANARLELLKLSNI